MKYKWLWLTSAFWILMGSFFPLRALIDSNAYSQWTSIHEFTGEMNGFTVKNKIERSPGSLTAGLIETVENWKIQGWTSVSGPLNLAAVSLGLSSDSPLLSEQIHLGLFQKGLYYRILGFLNDPRQNRVYRWTAEFDRRALSSEQKSSAWDFPLKPPAQARQPRVAGIGEMRTAAWSWIDSPSEASFTDFCAAQGFQGNPLRKNGAETVYGLRKGGIRIIAILKKEGRESSMTAVCF
jgi:hypothetical protein